MNFAGGKARGHMVDLLFTLSLFCVFAAASLLVVLIGSGVYQSTVDKMDANFQLSTSLSYVTSKVRQYDAAGALYVEEKEGVQVLVLEEWVEDSAYQTWIYCYDGYLRELYLDAADRDGMALAGGQALLEIGDFRFEMLPQGLLRIGVTSEAGESREQLVGLRSDNGEAVGQ